MTQSTPYTDTTEQEIADELRRIRNELDQCTHIVLEVQPEADTEQSDQSDTESNAASDIESDTDGSKKEGTGISGGCTVAQMQEINGTLLPHPLSPITLAQSEETSWLKKKNP